ncbi:MAG: polymer-forming cytoskeletal protein [Acidobacteriota bacterium]|jgi:hypothetical protein
MADGAPLRPYRPHRRAWLFALLIAAGTLAVAASLAGEVQLSGGQAVTVAADEVVTDDLYASGETVRIEGTVRGDLVAVGREVVIAGIVEGDVLAAGQSVTITGTVGDDSRIAGQVLHLGPEAQLGDDLMAAGFSLETQEGSGVGGTVRFFGYQALVAGEVAERLGGAMGALELAGTVHGDVDVEVGPRGEGAPPAFWPTPVPIPSVAPGLTVADTARLGGALRYESPTEGAIDPAAEIGEIEFRETAASAEAEPSTLERVADGARRFVALLLVGALLLWIAPRWTAGLAETVRNRPLPSLGWGIVFLAVAVTGVVAIALLTALLAGALGTATLGGLVAAVIGGGILGEVALVVGVLVTCAYLPPVVVGLSGGGMVIGRGGSPTGGARFLALALGVLVLLLLMAIPYLGKLVWVLVLLLGLGSLWLAIAGRLRRAEATARNGAGFSG